MKTNLFTTVFATTVAVAVTLASGFVFARIRHVAGMGVDTTPMVQRINNLPETFGTGRWTKVQSHELQAPVTKMLECRGYHYATYSNERGQTVQVVVLFGPAGPMAVHTPEICFSSRAYKAINNKTPLPLDLTGGRGGQLGQLDFQSKSPSGGILRVAYGWSVEGEWDCPDSSRREYAGSPYLYKVQIVMPVPSNTDLESHTGLKEFADEFLEFANEELFAS